MLSKQKALAQRNKIIIKTVDCKSSFTKTTVYNKNITHHMFLTDGETHSASCSMQKARSYNVAY